MNPNQILLILIVLSFLTNLSVSWLMFYLLANKLMRTEIENGKPSMEQQPEDYEPPDAQRTVRELKYLLLNR